MTKNIDRPSCNETWALPEIDLDRCDRCGSCVERCPAGAIDMTADGPHIARPEDCTYCAECDAFCPQGAVTCTFEIVWEAGALSPTTH